MPKFGSAVIANVASAISTYGSAQAPAGPPGQSDRTFHTPRTLWLVSVLVVFIALSAQLSDSASAAPQGFRLPIRTGSPMVTWGPGDGDHTGTAGSEALDFGRHADGSAIEGAAVYPVLGGRITLNPCAINPCNVFFDPGSPHAFGNYIDIDHSDASCGSPAPYRSRYAHLSRFAGGVSGCVGQNTIIGFVGNTGNSDGAHLHLQVTRSDGSAARVFDSWGILANPDWPHSNWKRAFSSTQREQLFMDAYNRNGGSGTLGGPRADLTIKNCPPACEGVPHFWANAKRLQGASGNIVTQNLNGPDNRVGGSDDSIIALYEVYSGDVPAAVPVYWRNSSGEQSPQIRAFVVRGGIWNVYAGAGGPSGESQMSSQQDTYKNTCGFPISDEMDILQHGITKRISYFSPKPDSSNSSPNWILWDPRKQRIFSNCVPKFGPDTDAYPLPGPAPRATFAEPVETLATDAAADHAATLHAAGLFAASSMGQAPPISGRGDNWATNPAAINWHAEFYRDTGLGSRCADWNESSSYIFKDWGESPPDGACPSDNWSARFTGTVRLAAGRYTFGLNADDWARIRLNGNVVVNKWPPNDQHYESYELGEGDYTISVEFADTAGLAKVVAWWWKDPDLPREAQDRNKWFVQYYGVRDPGWWDPVVSFNEATNGEAWWRNWDTASPGWGLPGDRYSARVQKTAIFNSGTTVFHMRVDDGGRLWIDDNLVLDKWSTQSAQYDVPVTLTAGLHRVRFEYYEEGGGAIAQVWWDSPAPQNDAFGYSTAIGTFPTSLLQSTSAAVLEANEPTATSCGSIGRTVWYAITPAAASQIEVSTAGSDFSAAIGVYTGGSLGALAEVACNGGGASTGDARVAFAADPGVTYRIQIGGASDAFGQLSVGFNAVQLPPKAPTALAITSASSTSLTLNWLDQSADEDGFKVERRQDTGEWIERGSVARNVARYTDSGLAAGISYQYRVLAFNAGGLSQPSNVVSSTTGLRGPTISSFTPRTGDVAGGTAFTLTGTNFAAGASVTFDGVPAGGVNVTSAFQLTGSTPPHAAGVVDVTVQNPDGQKATLPAEFTYVAAPVVIANGDFEAGTTSPSSWTADTWQSADADLKWDSAVAHLGSRSVRIDVPTPNDARWIQAVAVQPNTDYVVTGWVKTHNVEHTAESVDAGANLSIYGDWTRSSGVFGTSDWKLVTLRFNSGSSSSVNIAARVGFWGGTTTGTAWFDDIRITPAPQLHITAFEFSPPSGVGRVGERIEVRVRAEPMQQVSALRLRIDGAPGPEYGGPETTLNWNTSGQAPGKHTLTLQARPQSANGSWEGASSETTTYVIRDRAPVATSVTPQSGASTGGTAVTITGSNFAVGARVTFGGVDATSVTVVSPTSISAITPPHTVDRVDVVVINPDDQRATLANAYEYLMVGPAITALSVSPTSVVGSMSSKGTVTLASAAPANGSAVALSSSSAAAVVPPSVTVPAGATTATFTVTTTPVAAQQAPKITASAAGVSKAATLTVRPPALSTLSFSPASVLGGKPSTGTVKLSGAAPPGGLTVTLSSATPAVATVPASVTVPEGTMTSTFTVMTTPVAASDQVSISANVGTVTKAATLTVTAPGPSAVSFSPATVSGGCQGTTGTVRLAAAAVADTSVALAVTAGADALGAIPTVVVVPAGANSVQFSLTTRGVPSLTTVSISASANGSSRAASFKVRPPVPSAVAFSPNSVKGGTASNGTIVLDCTPVGDLVVSLRVTSGATAVAAAPTTVTVPAGSTSASFSVTSNAVTTRTSVRLQATASGGSSNGTLTVNP